MTDAFFDQLGTGGLHTKWSVLPAWVYADAVSREDLAVRIALLQEDVSIGYYKCGPIDPQHEATWTRWLSPHSFDTGLWVSLGPAAGLNVINCDHPTNVD